MCRKRFELVKDLPDLNSGVVFVEDPGAKEGFEYVLEDDDDDMGYSFDRDTVEDNEEWFQEIVSKKCDCDKDEYNSCDKEEVLNDFVRYLVDEYPVLDEDILKNIVDEFLEQE